MKSKNQVAMQGFRLAETPVHHRPRLRGAYKIEYQQPTLGWSGVRTPVFILGQATGVFIYSKNPYLISRERSPRKGGNP
jgi:hypothetical protein